MPTLNKPRANMVTVYIGIGSNLEQPIAQVEQAIQDMGALPDTRVLRSSPWYGSKAVGPGEQPDYVNGVAELETSLAPLVLLEHLQGIERHHGRLRKERWGPRTLDLDILLYGNLQLDTPTLKIPHPDIDWRNFVLYPLADLVPDICFPNGITLGTLVSRCTSDGLWRLEHGNPTPSDT